MPAKTTLFGIILAFLTISAIFTTDLRAQDDDGGILTWDPTGRNEESYRNEDKYDNDGGIIIWDPNTWFPNDRNDEQRYRDEQRRREEQRWRDEQRYRDERRYRDDNYYGRNDGCTCGNCNHDTYSGRTGRYGRDGKYEYKYEDDDYEYKEEYKDNGEKYEYKKEIKYKK